MKNRQKRRRGKVSPSFCPESIKYIGADMEDMRGRMNKRKILTWILRIAGIAVILYPLTLRVLSGLNQSEAIAGYEDSAAYYNQEMVAEEWAKAEEYNKSLSGTEVRDPFVPGSGVVIPDNYMEVLNIDRGIMGTLDIPCVDINLPIYHTVDAEVLEKGVGHLQETALPIGGENNHTVLSTHRGLPEAKLFTNLDKMEIGDEFYIHIFDRTLAYKVDQIKVVEPDNTTYLKPEEGKDYVTLLTCTPYGINSHRLLVRGVRTEYIEEAAEQTPVKVIRWEGYLAAAAGALSLILIIRAYRRRKKNRRKTE